MKVLIVAPGIETKLDDADYDLYAQRRWILNRACKTKSYIRERGYGCKGAPYLHRLIAGAGPGDFVDHVNGDTLDNRRSNLRLCTRSQNLCNSKKQKGTTSRYKGVYFWAERGKWQAYISKSGKKHHIGLYDTELEAAINRDRYTKAYHGEFGTLNI